jgi:phospholipid transport system substrate-binding protein
MEENRGRYAFVLLPRLLQHLHVPPPLVCHRTVRSGQTGQHGVQSRGGDMKRIISRFALVLVSALAVPFSLAQNAAPDELLKAVTREVLAMMRQDPDIQTGNPAKLAELVEARILPLFDFPRMTQSAVARNWRLATPEQQKTLTTEYRTLLVRTYSVALSSYRDQVVEYRPLRAAPDATEVTVKSDLKQTGREAMTIDYDMEKTGAGWKVYDIKIAGISLVTAYRDTFASRVRDGGIEGLIKSLSDKNRQDGGLRSRREGAGYIAIIVRSALQGVR